MQNFFQKLIHNKQFRFMTQWTLIIVVIVAIALFIFNVVLANQEIFGSSMQPNFNPGDRVLAYQQGQIKRGAVAIIKAPDENGENWYIKRIIGLPGDTVTATDDTVFINDRPIQEPYLTDYKNKLAPGDQLTQNFSLKELTGAARVPQGQYFVLGDNRRISRDSREFGFISRSDIRGIVFLKYWPLNDIQFYTY